MKKLDTKGFGAVEAILILVILGVIGGAGFLVYRSQNETKTTLDNAVNSQGETEKSEESNASQLPKNDETASWSAFTPNSKSYTIKLPDGWAFLHQNDECDCLLTKSMIFKKGTPATIETSKGGRDGFTGLFIATDDKDRASERFNSGHQKTGTVKIGDLEGDKYFYEQTAEPTGLGLSKGGKTYSYYIPKGNRFIYISYSVELGQQNNLELVEQAIQTLK